MGLQWMRRNDRRHLGAAVAREAVIRVADGGLGARRGGRWRPGLRFSPASQLDYPSVAGSILRVTGHFSDPAATTCVIRGVGYLESDLPAESAELHCREAFVVEGYEVIGSDPEFPEFGG